MLESAHLEIHHSRVVGLIIAVSVSTLLLGCEDKAQPHFRKCVKLEASGQLEEAWDACYEATSADPDTLSGRRAAEKMETIHATLQERVPETVTVEWCGRLRKRLEEYLLPAAEARYGKAGMIQTQTEHIEGVEVTCRQSAGEATAGLWRCRWDNAHDWDKYEGCRDRR